MALLEKHEADLPGFIEAVDPDGLALDQLVRALLEHWFDYVRENQHAWFMLFRDRSGDEEIQALRQRVNLRAREVIARGRLVKCRHEDERVSFVTRTTARYQD